MRYSIDGTEVEVVRSESGQLELRAIDVRAVKISPDLVKAVLAQHEVGRIHGRVTIDGHSHTISKLI